MTTCGVDWFSRDPIDVSYIMFIFTCHMIIPWSTTTYCYYKIFQTVRQIEVADGMFLANLINKINCICLYLFREPSLNFKQGQ